MNTRGKLTQESIVSVALEMLDAEGEKAFSMRKLATRLKVDPMAIYHHHANKSALVQAVLQAMLERCEIPEPSGNWQQDIRDLCQGLRQLARKHPGTFRIYQTYDDWLPAEHRLNEAFHVILLKAGLSRQSVVRSVRLLLAYTEAFAVDESTGWFAPEDRAELIDSLAQGPYPTLTDLIDEICDSNPDADFEFGLNVVIHGLESELKT